MATDAKLLQNEQVALSSELMTLTRAELRQLVKTHGGNLQRAVNEKTTLLIIGQERLPVDSQGRLHSNLRKARVLQQRGQKMDILSEEEFLERLGLQTARSDIHRLYTTSQLEQLLRIPARRLDSWVRSGLITPAHTISGINYFEFAQVSSARNLAELAASGISLPRLTRSLHQLQRWTSVRTKEALFGLHVYSRDGELFIETDDGNLADASGQLQLLFDDPYSGVAADREIGTDAPALSLTRVDTEIDWLARGLEHENHEEWELAEKAYLRGLEAQGPDATLLFNLGNVYLATDRAEKALETYRKAIDLSPENASCCNNIGVTLAELGRHREATEAFRRTLVCDPSFNDANYNLADALDDLGEPEKAAPYWRTYLQNEPNGEEADYARFRLRELHISASMPKGRR